VKLGIVGWGRFGRALGGLAADAGMDVCGLDIASPVDDSVRATTLSDLARGADVVVLAVPVDAVDDVARSIRPHVAARALVLDVCSVKAGPCAALEHAFGRDVTWVGTHPLFGPTSLARGEARTVVVCPNDSHPDAAARAREFWEALGCHVVEESPEAHDRVMAETHAVAFFLAKGILDAGIAVDAPFVPPSFRAIASAVEAVRSDAAHLFVSIARTNPHAAEVRRRLLDALAAADRGLASESPGAMEIPDLGARSPELAQVREGIDEIDRDLVALLARRAELARRAGRAKQAIGATVLDAGRESALLTDRARWAKEAGLDEEGVDDVFRSILRLSRTIQR